MLQMKFRFYNLHFSCYISQERANEGLWLEVKERNSTSGYEQHVVS